MRHRLRKDTLEISIEFAGNFNEVKHNVSHEKDARIFSVRPAILAYFIARSLGCSLYPLAKLSGDPGKFSSMDVGPDDSWCR